MLYLIPLIAAIAGWLLHKGLVYFVYSKVVPASQDTIAKRLAGYAATALNLEQLAGHLTDAGELSALKPEIERHIDVFLNEKLKEKMPMIAMFVGEKTIDKIKEGLLEEIDLLLPVILRKFAGNMGTCIDIGSLVYKKISKMDKNSFVSYVKAGTASYANKLAFFGALAGFVVGWLCVACFHLLN